MHNTQKVGDSKKKVYAVCHSYGYQEFYRLECDAIYLV
jgi:hypothetical protein